MVYLRNELKDLNLTELATDFVNEYNSGYICDMISDKADSAVPYGWKELCDWASEHYDDINDAVAAFGTPKEFDFFRIIQQGYFYANEHELFEQMDDIIKGLIFKGLIDNGVTEVTDEQFDKLLDFACGADNDDKINNLIDGAMEIINGATDE